MKRVLIPILVLIYLTSACEETPVTGSEDVNVISDVEITVDTTYVFGDEFRAEGTIQNTGRSTITPMWYLEMSVFSNSSKTFKFGGSNTSFNYSLSRGQATGWQIRYSNSQYQGSEYPDFAVGEFRAFKYADSAE
ncbi:MAG TPA: hypothetical protein DEQ34_05060 [Balneolaceae bacterium]|nr:hypothetical protein [Balneolaceae bacterium]|tara:strand:+ start:69542 stop:69946 length:405 start_codon:yes stop_codon:yes gene_type:complete